MWMLLHGFTGSPRSWDAVIAHAEFDEPPLRPTLLGHGSGWRDLDVTSFADEVKRLCALVSSQRGPRFIAGYSLGARVACGMLASAPELFDGALLIGVQPGLADDAARRLRCEADAQRAEQLRTNGLDGFLSDWERQPLFATQAALPAETQQQQRELRLQHDPEGLARSLDVLGLGAMPCYADALVDASVPVDLLTGSRDTKFGDIAAALAQRSARVEAISVEGAGHNLLLEAPEAVSAAMRGVQRRREEGASP